MEYKLSSKLNKLKAILKSLESCVLAYSGGVDSGLLLKISVDVLGNKILAVTANSPTYPKEELKFAKDLAKSLRAKHLVIKTEEHKNMNFIRNSLKRCYYCKRELFSELKRIARERNFKHVIHAANIDDNVDFRPGSLAAKAMKIRAPLEEAGISKKDIYAFSRHFNLPTKNKPSSACLASRLPYGEEITLRKLFVINNIESFIRGLGVKQVRLRHHGRIACIEVGKESLFKILKSRSLIVNKAKALGYNYVSLDLEGYRTGSLNEILTPRGSAGNRQ